MYFKRIEMQGFKSFADPVTIELNDGVTCIIGPNGSGKSNISDALRWVLGEQSSRQLRGSKMQDVIFAGTATRKPKGMAEVTLVIDNSAGILPLEYNEVAVTRRMFRSGDSEYLINGNQCRLRDIRELFMDTGIGVEGYSIIGQGKISDIVSTRPENRRQIFEEAAGIVLYKSRKTEAENKLSAAAIDLDRVRDIIAEIESRIDGLKEDSEKAGEYLELRDRYRSLSINIILHNLENLEANIVSGKETLASLQSEIDKSVQSLEESEQRIDDIRDEDFELSDEYSKDNAQLLETIDELAAITSGGKLNKERLDNIDKEITRLTDELSAAEERLAGEREELSRLEENEKSMNKEMDEVKSELEKAVVKFNDDNHKATRITLQTEETKNRITDINNANVTRNAEINTLTNYINTLEERKAALGDEIKASDGKSPERKKDLESIEQKISNNEASLKEKNESLKNISDNILLLNNELDDISERSSKLSNLISQGLARKNTIEEMEANYEGYNNVVRTIMSRGQKGIIGPVSDVIRVQTGLETAVETALGGNLQNIVCEDYSTAKAAIEWLKSTASGRATFLPVKSVRPDRISINKSISSARGFVGLASDMVDCDQKYKDIVDYLLCRVIIADDMDSAVSISKNDIAGFRIVTREGEVINSYGAITGGRFKNKTANLLDRKKEISKLNEEIESYKKELDSLNKSRTENESRIASLSEKRDDLIGAVTELDIASNVLIADKEHAEALLRESEDAEKRINSEIESIDSDIDRAKQLISGHTKQIEESEKEIKEAEAKIVELESEHEQIRPVIESDNEKIVALKVRIGENESRVLAGNEIIERVRDTISELEMGIEDNENARRELTAQRDKLAISDDEAGDKEKELSLFKAELEDRISKINSRLDELKKENEILANTQKEEREALEAAKDRKYKLEVKAARDEALIDTQKDKLWDEFEVSYAEALDMKDDGFAITAGNKESRAIRIRLAELGDVNVGAIDEYKAVSKRYSFMTAQEQDLTKAIDELEEIISNMDSTIKKQFKENFDKVVSNFEESFRELFGGGYAELRLEDENRPLESGIEITAQPPGKKLKNINLLSGGEKTLTAIALMFAVLKARPTPFVILDEVEAALDEINIERFSDYLRKFDNIQFALITHQKATMEHADVLYGVTMPEQGISRMLSLKLGDEFDTEGLE